MEMKDKVKQLRLIAPERPLREIGAELGCSASTAFVHAGKGSGTVQRPNAGRKPIENDPRYPRILDIRKARPGITVKQICEIIHVTKPTYYAILERGKRWSEQANSNGE